MPEGKEEKGVKELAKRGGDTSSLPIRRSSQNWGDGKRKESHL